MKLYATTTSERATKGQGGNEYVISEFSVDRKIIGQVELYLYKDEDCDDREWVLKFRNGDSEEDNDWDILAQGNIPHDKEKSKSQKGEKCKLCDDDFENPHKCN